MKKIFVFILLLPAFILYAQKKADPVPFANTITSTALKGHLSIIAGKEMEGRGTPSPGLERAANYIENHFRSIGLLPANNGSYRQHYPLYADSAHTAAVQVNGTPFEENNDFFTINRYSFDVHFSEAVFIGYGIQDSARDDYQNLDLKGKLVIVVDGAPAQYLQDTKDIKLLRAQQAFLYKHKYAVLDQAGAAAILVVSPYFPRKTRSDKKVHALNYSVDGYYFSAIPPMTYYVSPLVIQDIVGIPAQRFFEKMKTDSIPRKIYEANTDLSYARSTAMATASNIAGVLEGSDLKNEYVYVTAHYDHLGMQDSIIYYGADDDGSGTTAVLQLADAFAKAKAAGNGPRRTMVFMTVSGEESGLWGSAYYANHPLFPLEKATMDLNIDMIGRIDDSRKKGDSGNYIYIVGDDKLSSDLKTISEAVNKKYGKLELDYKFNDPKDPEQIYYRSDHYNFARHGVPVIFYYDGMLDADYHKPTDTPEKINYNLMAKRARLVFYTAWEIANRNDMLKRDIPLEVPPGF